MGVPYAELNAEYLKRNWLFGIRLTDDDGKEFPDDTIDEYIKAAIAAFEGYLDLAITPVDGIVERMDYRQDVWRNFGFIQLRKRPVKEITKVAVMFGLNEVFSAPSDWIRLEKKMGQYHLFPTLGSFASVPLLGLSALSPVLLRTDSAPHVHETTYSAGMDEVDHDLVEAIMMFATIQILNIMGDLLIGAGIANLSVGFDGWSQSIGTTSSATNAGYGARIINFGERLWGHRAGEPGLVHALRAKWRQFPVVIL